MSLTTSARIGSGSVRNRGREGYFKSRDYFTFSSKFSEWLWRERDRRVYLPRSADCGLELTSTEYYVHPCQSVPRAAAGPLDVGAYQFGAVGDQTGKPGRRVAEE